MTQEYLVSAVRGRGDLAGVFEFDGETGFFYMLDLRRKEGQQILGAIHVFTGDLGFRESDIVVRWDDGGIRVGLFLRGVQWAVFNGRTGQKFGGGYRPGADPEIPEAELIGAC